MANMLFAEEMTDDFKTEVKKYKLLIVDDDQSIHDVTKLALKAMTFVDFEIEVLQAYSAQGARTILKNENDVALALIDVVMETPEAGLELVDYIRNTLQNKLIRLIIRTGQANEFPQMQVVQRYDINDFKEKTELTLERLFTTIRSSIKQYEQLMELEQKYEETYRQMTTNQLTKLPNRIKLLEDFSNKSQQTLILIDIIGFSVINDSNGYDVGDFILKELGGFLLSMYGDRFNVYHLNNDLFALATTKEHLDNLVNVVERIKDDISKLRMITNNFNKTIETTIGVAYQSEDDVIRKAELALKEARNTGKNNIKFYTNDLKIIEQINNTNHWAPIIKNAIEYGGLLAYAQPIYDMKNNAIAKYELLVRLKHEDKIYSPINFLSAADKSGQLYNIFKFMFEEGCRLSVKLGKCFSVNISTSELENADLLEFMRATMQKHKANPELLSLEILETNAITQSEELKKKITLIAEMGVEFIIDDFGVQCSNFGQVEFLPVKTLKIDGSFIKELHSCKNSQIIVKTIQTFAKEKNFQLVAEFVCSKEVYDKVKELGIEFAQGYYLGEPALLE